MEVALIFAFHALLVAFLELRSAPKLCSLICMNRVGDVSRMFRLRLNVEVI